MDFNTLPTDLTVLDGFEWVLVVPGGFVLACGSVVIPKVCFQVDFVGAWWFSRVLVVPDNL